MANSQFEDILKRKAQGYKPDVPADMLAHIKAGAGLKGSGVANGGSSLLKVFLGKIKTTTLAKLVIAFSILGTGVYYTAKKITYHNPESITEVEPINDVNNSSIKSNAIVTNNHEDSKKRENKIIQQDVYSPNAKSNVSGDSYVEDSTLVEKLEKAKKDRRKADGIEKKAEEEYRTYDAEFKGESNVSNQKKYGNTDGNSTQLIPSDDTTNLNHLLKVLPKYKTKNHTKQKVKPNSEKNLRKPNVNNVQTKTNFDSAPKSQLLYAKKEKRPGLIKTGADAVNNDHLFKSLVNPNYAKKDNAHGAYINDSLFDSSNWIAKSNQDSFLLKKKTKIGLRGSFLAMFPNAKTNKNRGKGLEIFKQHQYQKVRAEVDERNSKLAIAPYIIFGKPIHQHNNAKEQGLSEEQNGSLLGGGILLQYYWFSRLNPGLKLGYQNIVHKTNYLSNDSVDGSIEQRLNLATLKLGAKYNMASYKKFDFYISNYWGVAYKLKHSNKMMGKYFNQALQTDFSRFNPLGLAADLSLGLTYPLGKKVHIDVAFYSEYLLFKKQTEFINLGGQVGCVFKF